MISMGLALSHAPAMFAPLELWPRIYAAIPETMRAAQPHTAALETPEVRAAHKARIDAALERMRALIADCRPDAIVVVGNDQNELFDLSNNPQLAIYTGAEIWGSSDSFYLPTPPAASRFTCPGHPDLALQLLKAMMRAGCDPANCASIRPAGSEPERGMAHMLTYLLPRLVPALDLPVVPVFLNTHYPPMPAGRRCWEIGLALGRALAARPERIVVIASGGMSHDPAGPRAGWIDEPLDRWIFERIEQDRGEELAQLFHFDSATLRGGTGELRAWISVAAACQWPGQCIDYIASHHAKTGLGFAHWPAACAHLNRLEHRLF